MTSQKNTTLQLIKLFAAYMVVFIHIPFPGVFGVFTQTFARFAVPLFFFVSGFFSYNVSTEKIKKRIKHIGLLIILSAIVYVLYDMFIFLINDNVNRIPYYFKSYLNLKAIIDLAVFNVPIKIGYHLWYLFALFYVYIIFYFVKKFKFSEKVFFIISFLLLITQLILGGVLSAFGIIIELKKIRNFIFVGIPFFGLGMFTKKHEEKLSKIPNIYIFISIILGTILSFFSRWYIWNNDVTLGAILILFAFTITFLKYPNANYPRFIGSLTDCTTSIYIFHIMIFDFIDMLVSIYYPSIINSNLYSWTLPIIICILSTILALILLLVQNLIKKHNNIIENGKVN